MRKYIIALMLMFATTVLYAKESGFSLSTALIGMSMDYREYDDNDKILDSEKSDFNEMVGSDFSLLYTKKLESENMMQFGANLMFLSGETEYVGAYLSFGLGYGSVVSQTRNIIFDTEVDMKYSHLLGNRFELSYGVGLGYRFWRRELSPAQVELYTWYSLRPKLALAYRLKSFTFGVNMEYQYGLNPQMTILADSENPDTTVNLGSADIFELSVPIKVEVHKKIELFVEYIYQNQIIEKSDTAPYIFNGISTRVYEPRSEANNQYVKMGAVFKF